MVQKSSSIAICLDESLDDKPPKRRDAETEADLIERAKIDSEAFGSLFDLYYQRILNYTFRCTLNLTVAEDITSNTFFKALISLNKYRRRHHFSAWLYSIATNEIRLHWRSEFRKRKKSIARIDCHDLGCGRIEPTAIEDKESAQEISKMHARLHEHLSLLPERYRSTLVLRFFEGLPYDVIAEVLGKRTGTVKSLVHRAVQRLKRILEQDATFDLLRYLE
jgi:RNA polymerase sigma-70 factor, ECF subfamily